jgi:uncharacterized protein YjbJ (UPF0337 family)
MNWDSIQGNWSQIRDRVKRTWSRLTDSDLAEIDGWTNQLVSKLERYYGYAREEAERRVQSITDPSH